MFEYLLTDALVYDGTGKKPITADIGIMGSKIAAIGNLSGQDSKEKIELQGKVIAPGFVDIHTHSDFGLLVDPRALSSIMQGVTTVVIGNCGFGCAPERNSETIKWNILGYGSSWDVNVEFPRFIDYLNRLRELIPGPNIFPLVSHGALRLATIGFDNRPASSWEITEMKKLLLQCIDEGAKGLSSGLEYSPGASASIDELRGLVEVIGPGIYSTHIRSRNASKLIESVEEALATVRGSGAHLQISHLAPRSDMTPEKFDLVMENISKSVEQGNRVGYDTLVYEWGPHQLADMLPSWLRNYKIDEVIQMLGAEEIRQRIRKSKRSSVQLLLSENRANSIVLSYASKSPEYVGKSFKELSDLTSKSPFDLALEILIKEKSDFLTVSLRTPFTSEFFLDRLLMDERCIPMSDGIDVCKDGPLEHFEFSRGSYGWAVRFIEQLVNKKKSLTLEEAIRRLTYLPASTLGLNNRGVLSIGSVADLVVFDRASLTDRSGDWGKPDYPGGIEHVFVNGTHVVEHGQATGSRAGLIL